jgi:UDP-N-acetylglucosamine 2-epimerase (non-hydrolysing)
VNDIAIVLGTRPEIVKTAPVMLELQRRRVPFRIVHTGQHYTPSLDRVFFEELGLPAPDVNLETGSLPPAHQVARMIEGIADAFAADRPRIALVQGDTNSVLAGGLAAHKLGVPIAHLEAGLRSDDWAMPEEANRVLVGHLAAIHFCPTEVQVERLAREGLVRGVHVVGNTAVDACTTFAERARARSTVLARLGLPGGTHGLLTMHRPSNVDEPARLSALVEALAATAGEAGARLVFPIHPRARAAAAAAGLLPRLEAAPFETIEPVGYLDMLALLASARFVLTDSGGVQEEACTLRVPCVTLRANTERPETVDVGANVLAPEADPGALGRALAAVTARARSWANPFGDGRTAARVVDVLTSPATRLLPSAQP